MKKKIVIAILCAAVSMGTIGCGNSTASAKTTQTQTDKKEDSKSENSEKSSEEKQSRDIFAMDTYMTVTAYGEHASEAVEKAETEIKRLDGMLSTGNENSEVYKLNQNGEAVVSDDTAYLYERSEKIYKQTKGVFDISIYPVMDAWGFTTENYRIPAEDELSALLKNVDASKIQYDKKTKKITLPKNVKIDFGGIAKGYTSSRIMQIYKKCGVTSGLVSLGESVGQPKNGNVNKKEDIQKPTESKETTESSSVESVGQPENDNVNKKEDIQKPTESSAAAEAERMVQ